MKRLSSIYILLISLILALPAYVRAADPWDGVASSDLSCLDPTKALGAAGSAKNPYLIQSGGDLKFLQSKSSYWNKNFIQTDDIDLNGIDLGGTIGTGSVTTAFTGTYDGQGHEIRNLKVNWGNLSSVRTFGLFGLIYTGTVQNLTLVNPRVVREGTIVDKTNIDLKIGILTGAVGAHGTSIRNISIVGGLITDSGHGVGTQSLFVGAIAGDLTSKFETYDAISKSVHGDLTIANVSVHCNIDLSSSMRARPSDEATLKSQFTQYNVGGIVGRARRARFEVLPSNTFFMGDIKAPAASVSPTVGLSRCNADGTKQYLYLTRAYAGEILNDPDMTSTSKDDDYAILNGDYVTDSNEGISHHQDLEGINPNDGHYYSAYRIWDYDPAVNGYVAFDNSNPAETGAYGLRTLEKNTHSVKNTADIFDPFDPLAWRCVQGVNHGHYAVIDPADGNDDILVMLNTYAAGDASLCRWKFDPVKGTFAMINGPRMSVGRSTFVTYTASTEEIETTGLKYRWEAKPQGSSSYTTLDTTAESSFTFPVDVNPDNYSNIRVTLCNGDGSNYLDPKGDRIDCVAEIEPMWTWGSVSLKKEAVDESHFKYVATVYNADGSIFMGSDEGIMQPGFTWFWEVSSDPTNRRSWETTDIGKGRNWIQPYRNDRYYRVSFEHVDDNMVVFEDLRGPKNMIFVYDQNMTDLGRHFGVTTFDGIDHSMPLTPEPTYYPDGDDRNSGYGPYHAVRTMARAYELAEAGCSYDENIIVVMGFYGSTSFLQMGNQNIFSKNVTITGNPTGLISGGAINISNFGTDSDPRVLGGHTKFEKINMVGYSTLPTRKIDNTIVNPVDGNLLLYCELHDLYIGEGVHIKKYTNMKTDKNGQIPDTNLPNITVIGGYHNYNLTKDIVYPEGNETPGVVTMTFNSGCWGRIIGGSRNSGLNLSSNNVYGSPLHPHRVTINVSISHPEGKGAQEYAEPGTDYRYDIGLLTGGQTDGTIYGDCEVNVNSGTVGRFLSGNISFGRKVGDNRPSDSFFGSCVVTLLGGEIEELYGGTLGRITSEGESYTDFCDAYFYGRSIININGGVINSDIYGAGAGGVTGMGHCSTPEHHTTDQYIPYYDSDDNLVYGDYVTATAGRIPVMKLRDGSDLSFDDSYCEVNINSGVIKGNIFGGGYGYSKQINSYRRALSQAGVIFGNTKVTMNNPYPQAPVVKGNIYGGGGGSSVYYDDMVKDLKKAGKTQTEAEAEAEARFGSIARVFGQTSVELYGGTVEGNVYGGSMGIGKMENVATIYGNSRVIVDGATVLGNIFGGCAFANVRTSDNIAGTGNTEVEIRNGVVGNNIFGGSEGSDEFSAYIEGNTSVKVLGGSFLTDPAPYQYKDPANGMTSTIERTFNIYGGGYHNGVIGGSTSVYIEKSLLQDLRSIATVESTTPADLEENYRNAIDDISFRRFCVYGGGFGEKTLVEKSARVNINIVGDQAAGVLMPTSTFPDNLVTGQTFFDVAGGGYNGDVGQWTARRTDAGGNTVYVPTSSLADPQATDYEEYRGGDVYVTIEGSAFVRKVIGGGFYASVNNAETWVKSGTIKSAYGGSLLGYVHNNARMSVGTHGLLPGEAADQRFSSDMATAALDNKRLFIVGDVYGGNDVKGIVGTVLWQQDDTEVQGTDPLGTGPMYAADVSPDTHKGVMLSIFGGTINGNVYGAGNGNYRGYYVPEWTRYNDGPARHYRYVRTNKIEKDAKGKVTNALLDDKGKQVKDEYGFPIYMGRVYRCRPMTGSVKIDISGNSEGDRVTILGNVYGGGRSCTIGQWNTVLPFEDPRRLDRGGYLHFNIGSHVTVENSVYLGARGGNYNSFNTVPADVAPLLTPGNYYGDNYADLTRLGNIAYDHWWWNTANNRYEPGFPPPGVLGGNLGYNGEHMFCGYMKNIEMNGDIEVTFYNDLYQRSESGALILDEYDNPLRKTWVPGELAVSVYDSEDVRIGSFYAGGECGSMTNNRVMRYDYDKDMPIDPEDPEYAGMTGDDIEDWGTIYRVTLPKGVTVRERVVGGSENATVVIYPYNSDFTQVIKTKDDGTDNALYTYTGGIVTQRNYTYDLIVYCDRRRSYSRNAKPADYLMSKTDPAYNSYTLTWGPDAGTTIYRYPYPITPMVVNKDFLDSDYGRQRYSLAVLKDGNTITGAYIGARDPRGDQEGQQYGKTALKMTLANSFLLRSDDETLAGDDPELSKHLYGGLVYGGCYNSGTTMGHVILNVASNLLGPRMTALKDENFGEMSSLRYNLGRVFGGGFGENTLIDGNTYVNLLHNFKGMNIFGGGCRGSVSGTTNIVYLGTESDSYIYGAIYGGSLQGNVGTENQTLRATNILLFSGNVDKVYGGSCMGNIYGATFVEMCDKVTHEIDHLDYDRLLQVMQWDSWEGSRLIVGSVFGGNDVAGTIKVKTGATGDYAYETTVKVYEVQGDVEPTPARRFNKPTSEPETPEDLEHEPEEEVTGPGKTSPGSDNGYNGFPLVGNLYGGSNGNYGSHDNSATYTDGSLWFSTGEGTAIREVKLGGISGYYNAFAVPHISRARIQLNGGTIINAYGGGNKATVTDEARIEVVYDRGDPATGDPGNRKARAGFLNRQELDRVWHVLHLSSEEQIEEVVSVDPENDNHIFDYQIFRLFGGNENADMAIQPSWDLQCGYIGSLYSGGNFGRMTYFNPSPAPGERQGLSLVIDSRDIHANSVYGGGRIGDIAPDIPSPSGIPGMAAPAAAPAGFYGATLEIGNGVIDHVYGGNDVSGVVEYGSNVNIHGAISGDVYCAGNGNYRYFYDPTLPAGSKIEEMYDDAIGGRYFRLPLKDGFGGTNPKAAQKILAINSYRPNVDKAWLNISGSEGSMAYVRGNVYCGGNSSTITGEKLGEGNSDIRFTIGNYVTLNGVFMGSNGSALSDGSMMYVTEQLNGVDLTKVNELTLAEALGTPEDHDASDHTLYPTLLDLYMRAVDVNGLPSGFDFPDNLVQAYIGDFYVGGNRGSMLSKGTININFPSTLVVYGKIVGGSNNANLYYKGVTHTGGLTRPLYSPDPAKPVTDKVHLTVKSRFEPWKLVYPLDGDERKITLTTEVETDAKTGLVCFPDRTCNVYGGCFASGRTVGNIRIDLYSDMTSEYAADTDIAKSLATHGIGSAKTAITKRRVIANGIDSDNSVTRRTFAVIGGGFGSNSEVYGDITVRLLPIAGEARPTTAAVFGGMQEGTLVGNARIELRDGEVLTNVYGGSEAAPMYGSTQVIVGYPDYYRCDVAGEYHLDRTDAISKAAKGNWINDDAYNTPVIKKKINLRKGDIISIRVYDIISDAGKASCFTLVDNELPSGYDSELSWDDIQIAVGDPASKTDPDAEYFAHGNIYGGGYVSAGSSLALAGQNTVCSFRAKDKRYLDIADIGRGGNSTILIWDNKRNARFAGEVTETDDGNGAAVRDHVDVGTGHYVRKTVGVGTNVMGLWKYNPSIRRFEHMAPHVLTAEDIASGDRYYTIESDGGIYGGGRKVFVENFRDVDIAYYGYAQGSPQFPKLINTAQRMDLLTLTDCCVHMQGANDFATNSVDATYYSLTRIGELQMISSLPTTKSLDKGDIETSGGFNTRHTTPRSRNYIAFYNEVRYVGAITSNIDFSAPFHDREGAIPSSTLTYRRQKENLIEGYYSIINSSTATDDQKAQAKIDFDRRNVGTAANMIGINNGYVLTIQGAAMKKQGELYVDDPYFGPVTGVFEVKLLTLTEGEGGGYIFGLNHHDDPASFLESTGNFVFPGAAYNVSEAESRNYNYIRDDCFPVGSGWENYWGWNENSTYSAGKASGSGDHGDCNELQECHYWYVNGTKYYYNVTLTAYTSNTDEQFTIDNANGIVYLYGLEPGAKLKVKEITWEDSENTTPDLTFNNPTDPASDLDYRFYLTVDKNPDVVRTPQTNPALGGNWYVTAIPRANFTADGGTIDADAIPTRVDDAINNAFGTGNVPQVGIALVDKNHDNVGREYYNKHLDKDENVRIVLTTGEGDQEFTYTINLTVRYLLGPTITGVPAIENCALPGEYIYVNSFNIDIDLDDDNMAINSRNWYMADPSECSDDGHGHMVISPETAQDIVRQLKGLSHSTDHIAESLNDQKFDNDRQIHIPAYLYRNDWRVIYEVVINGKSYILLPDLELHDVDNKRNYEEKLLIHNYHRMRPYDGTSILMDEDGYPVDLDGIRITNGQYVERIEDLRLIPGSRIYIEDDSDMAYFFTWLRKLQSAPTRTTPDGHTIDPRYGEGLYVYLMNNVSMPSSVNVNDLIFRGTFHGGGHYIYMDNNKTFLGDNQGWFYNTGFVSETSDNNLAVFAKNGDGVHNGVIENCYFYNAKHIDSGTLVKGSSTGAGTVTNCFETHTADIDTGDGLRMASYAEFNYGKIAFNLNRFYLKKRYNLATGTPDGELLAPLMFNYNDGEYRFARWSPTGEATALRTAEVPNYHDYRGIRINMTSADYGTVTGFDATFHNSVDLVDTDRYDEATGLYLPNYPDDFLFFGQDLSQMNLFGLSGLNFPGIPSVIDEYNRVYRASGYYGSTADKAFHFNSACLATHPSLTAIDFAGYRDRQLGMNYFIEDEADNYPAYKTWQPKVYYPPMLDLPKELIAFIPAEGVTRNLLVYAPEDDVENPAKPLLREALDEVVYTRDTRERDVYAHVLTSHLPENVHTVPTEAHRPTVRLFHLVDKENFHCPIEFEVTDSAWYQREPEVFASTVGDAWEGLCLPFSVRSVWSTIAEREGILSNPIRNRGELTHFYGADSMVGYYRLVNGVLTPVEGHENETPSHEYWLRKFTQETEVDGKRHLYFARPDGDDDVARNAGTPYKTREVYRRNYFYSNPAFSTVYGAGYTEQSTHSRPCYTPEGAVYDPYPLITAGLPYIIAFPGKKFYEFDMSGQFYADHFPGTPVIPQIVTYGSTGAATGSPQIIIPVTTDDELLGVAHDSYTFRGTFTKITTEADASIAVIDEDEGHTEFVSNASAVIWPFRTYIQRPSSDPKPLFISGRSSGGVQEELVDPQGEDRDDGDDDEPMMEIYVEFNELVIQSPWDTDLTIYNIAGQAVRQIRVEEGLNRYTDLAPGYYVVLSTKFRIN